MKSTNFIYRSFRFFIFRNFSRTPNLNYTENNEGPLSVYHTKVNEGELLPDPQQLKMVNELEALYHSIQSYEPPKRSVLTSFFGSSSDKDVPKGLYIYGAVGGGKTMLMDLFYSCIKVLYFVFFLRTI